MAVLNKFQLISSVGIWYVIICVKQIKSDIYVDYGNPYDVGEFNISTRTFNPVRPINPPPIYTKAFYPSEPGEYAVIYFVTGLGGILPPAVYNNYFSLIATHGYIVFQNWNLLGDGGIDLSYEAHVRQLEWLSENTADELDGAIGSFDNVGLACHSAGCGPTLNMLFNDSQAYMAMGNIEPVTIEIIGADIDFSVPTLNFGAELANMSCSYPGVDFEAFHEKGKCPKILIEAEDVGHCDILDREFWLGCNITNFCITNGDDYLVDYKLTMMGILSSFMTGYLQGNMDQLEYITNVDNIPWGIKQHEVEIDSDC